MVHPSARDVLKKQSRENWSTESEEDFIHRAEATSLSIQYLFSDIIEKFGNESPRGRETRDGGTEISA